MDCQAITLGEHLLWEVLFKSFGYKNGRPWGRPFLLDDGANPGQAHGVRRQQPDSGVNLEWYSLPECWPGTAVGNWLLVEALGSRTESLSVWLKYHWLRRP